MIGVGRTTLYRLLDCGDIPAVHIGRRRLVRVADLAEYVERITPDEVRSDRST